MCRESSEQRKCFWLRFPLVLGLLLIGLLLVPAWAGAAGLEDALAYVDDNREVILKDWLQLIGIPSPSRQEDRRAEWVRQEFLKIGLTDVRMDDLNNVSAFLPGEPGAPTILFAAHTDTVFAMDTPINPVVRDGRIYAPGSGDDASAVIAMLYAVKALKSAGLQLKPNLIFLADVQEEIGLNGMRHFLSTHDGPVDMVIAVDGGLGGLSYGALGIQWLKVKFTTPGGHTNNSRGKPSATRTMGMAIDRIYRGVVLPEETRTVMNIGVVGGGTVPNAIAADTWMTVDMRSMDAATLTDLIAKVTGIANATASETGATVKFEVMTDIPAGLLPGAKEHRLTQTAASVMQSLGVEPKLSAAGSTDANVAIAKGIQAVAFGVTTSGNGHSVDEYSDIEPIYRGIKQLIMLAASLP